jgi:hypothetical protein
LILKIFDLLISETRFVRSFGSNADRWMTEDNEILIWKLSSISHYTRRAMITDGHQFVVNDESMHLWDKNHYYDTIDRGISFFIHTRDLDIYGNINRGELGDPNLLSSMTTLTFADDFAYDVTKVQINYQGILVEPKDRIARRATVPTTHRLASNKCVITANAFTIFITRERDMVSFTYDPCERRFIKRCVYDNSSHRYYKTKICYVRTQYDPELVDVGKLSFNEGQNVLLKRQRDTRTILRHAHRINEESETKTLEWISDLATTHKLSLQRDLLYVSGFISWEKARALVAWAGTPKFRGISEMKIHLRNLQQEYENERGSMGWSFEEIVAMEEEE